MRSKGALQQDRRATSGVPIWRPRVQMPILFRMAPRERLTYEQAVARFGQVQVAELEANGYKGGREA